MATARKKRCKHGRNPKTGRCRKAPAKGRRRKGGASTEWTAERVAREEAMADKMYGKGWRDYGEEGPSRSRPFGSLGRMRRRRRR